MSDYLLSEYFGSSRQLPLFVDKATPVTLRHKRTQLRYVDCGRVVFVYSYKTPIAVYDRKDNVLHVSHRATYCQYSKTTTRHTNMMQRQLLGNGKGTRYNIDEQDLLELANDVYEIAPDWN